MVTAGREQARQSMHGGVTPGETRTKISGCRQPLEEGDAERDGFCMNVQDRDKEKRHSWWRSSNDRNRRSFCDRSQSTAHGVKAMLRRSHFWLPLPLRERVGE